MFTVMGDTPSLPTNAYGQLTTGDFYKAVKR
jgi:hypothetical protein